MKCSCPKCAVEIELEVVSLPPEGAQEKCPECKTKFPVRQESFAARAVWKGEDLTCAQCGTRLGPSTFCPGCLLLFPDYLVTQQPKAKESRSLLDRINIFQGFTIGRSSTPDLAGYGYTAEKKTAGKLQKLLLALALLGVVAGAAAGGVTYYRHVQQEKQYAKNFIMALYGIKTGADATAETFEKTSVAWRARGESTAPVRLGLDDEARLKKIRTDTDKYMQKLNKPPEKFTKASEKLGKVYASYTKLDSLATSPPPSYPSFADSVGKAGTDFSTSVQELKGNLPPELAEELKAGEMKFKKLREL